MGRYKITVSYDGAAYKGWQVQPGCRTIQGEIESVLERLNRAPVKVHGSGRTDAGVHALGQVAHFDLERAFEPQSVLRALNGWLPPDIRIMRSEAVSADFHARKSARQKEYRYFIRNRLIMPPLERNTHLHVRNPLDVDAMRAAAALFVGRHDFAAFTANPNRVVESTVRTVFALDVRKKGSEVILIAVGEGFLYKMVRSLAGWLVRVGKGEVAAADTLQTLDSEIRTAAVPTAAAHGLVLWKVRY